ncbi:MAG: UDP-N-acetylglucosamine 2-epimerase (hydrolyzing), partial [Candidatus Omnitrophica bacterium]|nr:UDP-N-acetylglucosamine 2-epimerase (hydrolyzing) [Candidatus Omnitrophota bacterium]
MSKVRPASRRAPRRSVKAARRILFITGSRGEWGYIRPILRLMKTRDDLSQALVVTNMHLLPEFGTSVKEITEEGWRVDQEIYMALDGYVGTSMTKSLGVFLLSIVDTLHRIQPHVVVLAGDRGEQLMTALAAAHMNIPVAHIQAGEISGNIDGMTRHAMARFVHLHFAANEEAAERLRRSGEEAFRIVTVGAPQLDELLQVNGLAGERVAAHFHLDAKRPVVLVVQHPVTEQIREARVQMETTLHALAVLHHQTVLIYPNNDAGSALVRDAIDAFRAPWLRVVRNVSREDYAGLLRVAGVLVGNSSS